MWVRSARKNPGIPTGPSWSSTICPTYCEVVDALRKSWRSSTTARSYDAPQVVRRRSKVMRLRNMWRIAFLLGCLIAPAASGGAEPAPGLYRAGGHSLAVVADPYGPARLVDLETGKVNALFPAGNHYELGSGYATRAPARGVVRFAPGGAVIASVRATRLATRELEVRFTSAGATLAG